MATFEQIVQAIGRIDAANRELAGRLERLAVRGPIVPVVRASIETGASHLRDVIARETPFDRPRDMLADEWAQPAIRTLFARIATLELAVQQRPSDLRDWVHDLRLAMPAFSEALARFDREIER